jgi:hypothetical protein
MRAKDGSVKGLLGAATLFFVLLVAGSFSAHAWNYRYDSAWDVGIWTNNGIDRFRYWYGVTAWQQYSQWGGWQTLGNYGWSPVARNDANPANFIGDGTYRNLTNGWWFAYGASGDYSAWKRNADGKVRFSYAYGTGLWNDSYTPTNTWAPVGTGHMSSTFIGDGTYRNVGNGWIFGYYAGGDASYWKRAADGLVRFAYSYGVGQWNDVYSPTNAWAVVGTGGIGPAFIGDGVYRDVGNGWLFAYCTSGDYSAWKLAATGKTRFAYDYRSGLWLFTGDSGGWYNLVSAPLSPSFVGDAQWHNLTTGWAFKFVHTNSWDLDLFSRNSGQTTQFEWQTTDLHWYMIDGNYGTSMPGFDTLGTAWMWDGLVHQTGNWRFKYDYGPNELAFYAQANGSNVSFLKYSWVDHKWYDRLTTPGAVWCHIPMGGSTDAEIFRAYWAGYEFANPDGEYITINADYTAPSETIRRAGSSNSWVYTYLDGTWIQQPGNTVLATGANPDLYR